MLLMTSDLRRSSGQTNAMENGHEIWERQESSAGHVH
jgi:hypothetical protein